MESNDSLWAQLRDSVERLGTAAQRKSDPKVLEEKLAARAKQLRKSARAEETIESPLVILAYTKGGQRFGIPASDVLEVQALERFTPVPWAPQFITGVIQWRGSILSLLDVGRLFEMPESGLADIHVCLIVAAAGRRVAVVALEVEEILAVSGAAVQPPPELAKRVPQEWLLGIHDGNQMILNMESILRDARLIDWKR